MDLERSGCRCAASLVERDWVPFPRRFVACLFVVFLGRVPVSSLVSFVLRQLPHGISCFQRYLTLCDCVWRRYAVGGVLRPVAAWILLPFYFLLFVCLFVFWDGEVTVGWVSATSVALVHRRLASRICVVFLLTTSLAKD